MELDTLGEAISVAEQEDFSLRQDQASSSSYRPLRRQEHGVPEPMDLSYIESEKPRYSNNKRLQKCNRCQKLGHYAHECSAPRPVPRDTERNYGPNVKKATVAGPTLLRNRNNEADRQKTVGVSSGAAPQIDWTK